MLLRLVPDDTKFPFMRWRRIFFPLSALVTVISLGAFAIAGLNLGIDFRGGTLIEVQVRGDAANLAAMRTTLGNLNLGDVQLQEFGVFELAGRGIKVLARRNPPPIDRDKLGFELDGIG